MRRNTARKGILTISCESSDDSQDNLSRMVIHPRYWRCARVIEFLSCEPAYDGSGLGTTGDKQKKLKVRLSRTWRPTEGGGYEQFSCDNDSEYASLFYQTSEYPAHRCLVFLATLRSASVSSTTHRAERLLFEPCIHDYDSDNIRKRSSIWVVLSQ